MVPAADLEGVVAKNKYSRRMGVVLVQHSLHVHRRGEELFGRERAQGPDHAIRSVRKFSATVASFIWTWSDFSNSASEIL